MSEAGHNNPPGMIEAAREVTASINQWLTDHPVIENEEMAREAKLQADRGKLGGKDLDDERVKKVAPLNMEVQRINDTYRQPSSLLKKITDEVLRRLTDYISKEEAKRIKAAEEARKAAEAARQAAEEAEAKEKEAVDDASWGAEGDFAAVVADADSAYQEFRRAERAATLATREAKVRVGGGFTRSLSLRNKETLYVVEAVSAINAIGLTPDIEAAILKGARAYRSIHNKLPLGIGSKTERSA